MEFVSNIFGCDCAIEITDDYPVSLRKMGRHCGLAVLANGFNRTRLESFFALLELFRAVGLLVDVAVTFAGFLCEVVGSCLTANVAIDAIDVHVPFSTYVLRLFFCRVRHIYLFLFLWPYSQAPSS